MSLDLSRRALLAAASAVALPLPALAAASADPWSGADAILARIKPPAIPKRDFPITRYGAKAGADASAAIKTAIAAASKAGGGRVVIPAGDWPTGGIRLLSKVELHLEKGATLKFSQDPNAYLPLVLTRHEGIELMNYAPFIYAYAQHDIAVTGEGTLDGQADRSHWWNWPIAKPGAELNDRALLAKMGEDGVPPEKRIFGPGFTIRVNFFQPYRCQNVLVEGVTINNSPMWEINPVECVNVTVRGLNIHSHGPNNDGCDPESCRDVLIENCVFDTGDDCIAIKSGRNADGRRLHVPAENHIIRGCRMMDGHGGVTLGSEITGGCRNIFIENCQMDSPNLNIALRFKNNAMRGGDLENVFARNITVGQVAQAVIAIDYNYDEGSKGPYTPIFRNLVVEKLISGKSQKALDLQGFPNAPIERITLRDCQFNNVGQANTLHNVKGLVLERCTLNGAPFTQGGNFT